MPASSKAQRRFMGMVTALKKGTLKTKNLPKSVADKVKKAAASMTTKAAHDFAKTKEKGLPKHVKEDDLCLDLMTFTDFLIFESALAHELTEDDALLIEQMIKEGAKPSAGLTKKEKSTLVKRAKHGEDVGKKGKKFKDVAKKAAKKYGSKQAGERVAAAAMWKSRAKKHLNEGPLDFARGAAGEAGQMIKRANPITAARNIIGAGQAASHSAKVYRQLQDLVNQFVDNAAIVIQHTQQAPAQQAPAQQAPAQQAPAQQAPAQQAPNAGGVAPAFQTKWGKQKRNPNRPLQFSSFIQQLEGGQLDEAFADYAKGAGNELDSRADKFWKGKFEQRYGSFLPNVARNVAGIHQAGKDALLKAEIDDERKKFMAHSNMLKYAQQIKRMVNNDPTTLEKVKKMIAQKLKNPNDPRIAQMMQFLQK